WFPTNARRASPERPSRGRGRQVTRFECRLASPRAWRSNPRLSDGTELAETNRGHFPPGYMKNRNWYGKCPSPDIRFTTRASTWAYPIVTGSGSYRASLFQFILDSANAARLVSSQGPWPACRIRRIGRGVLRAPWKYDPPSRTPCT